MANFWIVYAILFGLASVVEATAATASPVVVELFESEGCSSCPPAETVLQKLQAQFGERVILLTFHVDYWDSLGWKDPFSSPAFTSRQKEYAGRFGQDSLYTPEIVIQGQVGFVGSDGGRAEVEIRRRSVSLPAAFLLTVQRLDALHLKFLVQDDPRTPHEKTVTVVLYEDAPPVHVLRGENAGATMSGDHAVRWVEKCALSPKGEALLNLTPSLASKASLKAVVLSVPPDEPMTASLSVEVPSH